MPRPKQNLVPGLGAAEVATGLEVKTLSTIKACGCPAFRSSGCVNLDDLAAWLDNWEEHYQPRNKKEQMDLTWARVDYRNMRKHGHI